MNDLINITDKDIISIVGSGGKTSLMYRIARHLSDKKVLLSTTTKIKIPTSDLYDYIAFNEEEALKVSNYDNKGIYLLAHKINEEKFKTLDDRCLNEIVGKFNNVILEADGAKEKLIKGWNENEPVIFKDTTKTIGVVNLDTIGLLINEENVHRLDKFLDITKKKIGDNIDIECLVSLISADNGLFKNFLGKKVLFINGVETKAKEIVAKEIGKTLRDRAFSIDYIIAGSIIKGVFFEL